LPVLHNVVGHDVLSDIGGEFAGICGPLRGAKRKKADQSHMEELVPHETNRPLMVLVGYC